MEYGLVLVWIGLYVLLSVVALPGAALVFRPLPDRGSGLALPFALGVLGVVGYWVGHVRFGLVAALAGVVALAALSAVAVRRGVAIDRDAYVEATAAFLIAFLFMIAVRAVDPGAVPGGGEKFLDLGLLSSLLRTDVLPPEDMWFAGKPVQYYYGGHMIAALLASLARTQAEYAYNLALAGYYATLVSAAYGLARSIAASRDRSPRVAGGFAAVFVGVASNLSTPVRFLAWLVPGGTAIAETLGVARGRYSMETIAYGLGKFSYWHASGNLVGAINEFPLFSFLNGDMHAHMMSTPFLLLAAALSFAYWATPAEAVDRRRVYVFLGLPAVAGLLATINTWSFPSAAGLGFVTMALAPADPVDLLPGELPDRLASATARRVGDALDVGYRLPREAVRAGVAALIAAGVGLLGVAATAPFFRGMVFDATGTRHVAVFPDRAGLLGLLLVHGAFLSLAFVHLLVRFDADLRRFETVVLALVLGTFAWFLDAMVLFAVAPLLVAVWTVTRTRDDVGFEGALFVAATGLVVLVEFVYLAEQAGPGRMNTVFKSYMQVWVLFSVAGGVMVSDVADLRSAWSSLVGDLAGALAWLDDRVGGDRRETATDGGRSALSVRAVRGSSLLSWDHVGSILAAGLVVSTSVYGAFALAGHFGAARSNPTLDATAYVDERHPVEAEAIEWIDDREGQPTIVTAPGTSIYRWVNAPSSLTGVPTVAGWIHEVGYRGADAYFERVEDVETIFTGDSRAQARLLLKYDVEYVYVGPNERDRYDGISIATVPGVSVERQFGNGEVTIYAVDQDRLRAFLNGTDGS